MTDIDKPKTKTTQIVEGILFSHVFKHSISVGVDGIHATKRIVQIFGPLVHITDPNKLLPNLFLFLPMWEITPKKSKNHRTLILRSEKVEDVNEIKIKTKNIKLLNMLSKQFLVGKECLINQQLRYANHSVRLNKDGAFVPAKYQMANDYVKVIVGDKVIVDLPRYPDSWAGPNLNDYEKVHFYRGDHMTATLKCKDMLQAMKIIVEMNMIPDDLETIPNIFTKNDDVLVPEVDESAFDNTSGSILDSSNQISEDNRTEDEDEEEEDEAEDGQGKKKKKKSKNEEIPLKEKKKKKRKGVEAMADFSVRMEEKLEKVQIPSNDNKIHERKEYIEQKVSQFQLKVPVGTSPPITVPEKGPNDNDILPWEMPRSAITNSLFMNQIKIDFEDLPDLKTEYNVSQVLHMIKEKNQKAINLCPSIKPIDKDIVPYDEAFADIQKLAPEKLPEFVTGVFLHGRIKSYKELAHSLTNISFSCKRIREIFQSTRVTTKKTFYRFFFQLFKEGLTGTFFRSLVRFPYFRLINYYPDSLMRIDDTLTLLTQLEVKLPPKEKPKSKPKIPFKMSIYPHIILANEIPKFQQNQTEIWIDEENKSGVPTSFSMIIAACITLMAMTYSDRDPKLIVYQGQLKKLWKTFKHHSKNLGPSFEPVIENLKRQRAHQVSKVVELLIHALVENKMIEFLINFMKCNCHKNEVMQHLILCVHQLERLNDNFPKDCLKRRSIIKQTVEDLTKVFERDPYKKRRAVQPVDPNKELINMAGNKINQIVGSIEDKTGIKIKKNNDEDEDDGDDDNNNNDAKPNKN